MRNALWPLFMFRQFLIAFRSEIQRGNHYHNRAENNNNLYCALDTKEGVK